MTREIISPKNLKKALKEWFDNHGFKLTKEWLSEREDIVDFQLEHALYDIFLDKNGLSPTGHEHDCSTRPKYYLSDLSLTYLSEIGEGWNYKDHYTFDKWENAFIELENEDGRNVILEIGQIYNSKYVPDDFFRKFESFTSQYCSKTLMTFLGPDGQILIVYLPHDAAKDMRAILSQLLTADEAM